MTTLTANEKIESLQDGINGINECINALDAQIAALQAEKQQHEAFKQELIEELGEAREEKENENLILDVEKLDEKDYDFNNQEMIPVSEAIEKNYYPVEDWNMMGRIQKIYKSSLGNGWTLKFTDGSRCPMFETTDHINSVMAAPPKKIAKKAA